MKPHRHDWKPIPTWFGRYECKVCKVKGHMLTDVEHPYIVPYACHYKGCRNSAVTFPKNTHKGRCWDHRPVPDREKFPKVSISQIKVLWTLYEGTEQDKARLKKYSLKTLKLRHLALPNTIDGDTWRITARGIRLLKSLSEELDEEA